jgi:P4 family phage/plasmid primase-like protien
MKLTAIYCDAKVIEKADNSMGPFTHTRMSPEKDLGLFCNKYNITDEKYDDFMKAYYQHVIVEKNPEFLTEKQLPDTDTLSGPLVLDLDFKYKGDVKERKHTQDDINTLVDAYLSEIQSFFEFEMGDTFKVYVMEKPNVNYVADKKHTKDGIHIIFGLQVNRDIQTLIRNKMVIRMESELPGLTSQLLNNWNDILDKGITSGSTNWMVYGSRKAYHESYRVTMFMTYIYDSEDNQFGSYEETDMTKFDLESEFPKLTVRYKQHPRFKISAKGNEEINAFKNPRKAVTKKMNSSLVNPAIAESIEAEDKLPAIITYDMITDEKMLEQAIQKLHYSLSESEYYIKEIHEYVMILPEKFYKSGASHLENRNVAFALKHTDNRLFLTWVALRSKADDFRYSEIPELLTSWERYFNKNDKNPLTKRSIIYWAKEFAPEEFEKIKVKTIDHFIDDTIYSCTDFDLAQVLHHMYKDEYVCSSIKNNVWYVYNNHRWEVDNGKTLRLAISKNMCALYLKKCKDYERDTTGKSVDKKEMIKRVISKLKTTSDKNNIMREAQELFYDKNFTTNIDSNKYLLGFVNGVYDFKLKTFREGRADDYITKTTKIPYVTRDTCENYDTIESEINEFMAQLFPEPSLCKYMWDHLASVCIGTNMNQTFNIYKGSGSNGKSILTDLMTQTLGDYKGMVPLSLITEKRGNIGGTSSEVMQLKGIRYAVMQEPSKDMRINEGVMKEIVGGDPLQGRSLYQESETFDPQFKLAVCTNVLFDIHSNDDGTWRRIRIVPFMSKFVAKEDLDKTDAEYKFIKDRGLKEKLVAWGPVFASLLIDIATKTDGVVNDCEIVLSESNKYRQGQDNISAFINDKISVTTNLKKGVMKCEIRQEFDLWFQQNGTHSKKPKITEVNDYMDKRFGKYKARGWVGTSIKPDIPQEEDGEEEEDGDIDVRTIDNGRNIRAIDNGRNVKAIDNGKKSSSIEYDGSSESKM